MRTHGHGEGSSTLWGLLGGMGEGQWEGSWGEITWGEMPDMGEGEEGNNHTAMCVPMQLSCMFFTCTQNLKCNKNKYKLKKKKEDERCWAI